MGELGVEIVLHSATKYLGGHSDVIGGVIVTNNEEIKKSLDFSRLALGLNPSPFDTWLLARSVKTLVLRMERHATNALTLAKFLSTHPLVSKVIYPGLEQHPQHAIAKKQMKKGFGGVMAVEFNLSLEETKKLISNFKYISLAESLGGVESLIEQPASMTHASIPASERAKIGLGDGLVRFSVGIEDVADLQADMCRGLQLFMKK
eukprot:Platyproteum_vivax@DN10454_c0_g1_i1.p1